MAIEVTPPFKEFTDLSGAPLDNGYIYIGTENLNPEVNLISIYWDSAMTIPASNPLRTISGYPARNGSPARIYCGAQYSITVKDKSGVLVYSSLSGNLGSVVSYVDSVSNLATLDNTNTASGTVIVKDLNRGGTFIWSSTGTANGGTVFAGATGYWTRQYSGSINVKWFGAKGDYNGVSGTDDTISIQSCLTFCVLNSLVAYAPSGRYKTTGMTLTPNPVGNTPIRIIGDGGIYIGTNTFTEIVNTSITGDDCIFFNGTSTNQFTRIELQDIRFKGNPQSGNGINVLYGGELNCVNVISDHHGKHGLYYKNSWVPRLYKCDFKYNGSSSVLKDYHGVFIEGSSLVGVNGSSIIDCTTEMNYGDGINIIASSSGQDSNIGTIINYNSTSNYGAGLRLKGISAQIIGGFAEFNGGGGIIAGVSGTTSSMYGLEISGMLFDCSDRDNLNSGVPVKAIELNRVVGGSISGVFIRNALTTNSIIISADSSGIEINSKSSCSMFNSTKFIIFGTKEIALTYKKLMIGSGVSMYSTSQTDTFDLLDAYSPKTYNVQNNSTASNILAYQFNRNATAMFGIRNSGALCSSSTSVATTLGTVSGKMPIYGMDGVFIGWIPLYNTIT